MKSVDMSEESEVERVLAVIGDVLKHVATRVTIDGTAPDGSPVEASYMYIDIDWHDSWIANETQANWNVR